MTMHSIDSLDAREYAETDIIDRDGPPIHVRNRMTRDEVDRDLSRVDRLDEQLQELSVTIRRYGIHGQLRRVSAVLTLDYDPLENGILVGNVEGFSVESVQPDCGTSTIGIRFQEDSE
jgi:hypothetical protein